MHLIIFIMHIILCRSRVFRGGGGLVEVLKQFIFTSSPLLYILNGLKCKLCCLPFL